jgi:hypothetical protein
VLHARQTSYLKAEQRLGESSDGAAFQLLHVSNTRRPYPPPSAQVGHRENGPACVMLSRNQQIPTQAIMLHLRSQDKTMRHLRETQRYHKSSYSGRAARLPGMTCPGAPLITLLETPNRIDFTGVLGRIVTGSVKESHELEIDSNLIRWY